MPSRSTTITPPCPTLPTTVTPQRSLSTSASPPPSANLAHTSATPRSQPNNSARDARERLISNINSALNKQPNSKRDDTRLSAVSKGNRESSNLTFIGGLFLNGSDTDSEYDEFQNTIPQPKLKPRTETTSMNNTHTSRGPLPNPFSNTDSTISTSTGSAPSIDPPSPPKETVTVRTRARAGTVTRDAYVPPPKDLLSARSATVQDYGPNSPRKSPPTSPPRRLPSSPPQKNALRTPRSNPKTLSPPEPTIPLSSNTLGLMPSPIPLETPPLAGDSFPTPITPPTLPSHTVPRLREPIRTPPSGCPVYPVISAQTQPRINQGPWPHSPDEQGPRPSPTLAMPPTIILPPLASPISPLLAAPPRTLPFAPPSSPFSIRSTNGMGSPSVESDNESIVGFEFLKEKKALLRGGEEELFTPFSPRIPGPRPRTRIGQGSRPDTVMDFWKRFSVSVKLDQKVGDSGWLKKERRPMWKEPKFVIPICIVFLVIATIIFLAVFLPHFL